jgi:hypothetical protein
MIKAKRDDILNPLSAVSGIIERRHTLPILSNVLIEQTGQNLSFRCRRPGKRKPLPSARASWSTSCVPCPMAPT